MIYKLLLFTIFISCLNHVSAQGKVVVNINNIRNDNGVCRICLYDDADAFNEVKGHAYVCSTASIKNNVASVVFENVPAGSYAIMVFHDENDNHKLDKNFLGIPCEGYGASRNKLPFAAAPNFKDNMFSTTGNTTSNISIRLRNL